MEVNKRLVLALPKGRLLNEVMPLVRKAGIKPEIAFEDSEVRQLRFKTNIPNLDIIRVRSFDVATFVAFGAAHIGVVGNDVLMEFDYPELYAPLDLNIGHCRVSVAELETCKENEDPETLSTIRVATKYPDMTHKYFLNKGVNAECIKLSGAMELAPQLGLCQRIVDLVSTGATLKANGLVEIESICDVTARLIVNRVAWKTDPHFINEWVDQFREVVNAKMD